MKRFFGHLQFIVGCVILIMAAGCQNSAKDQRGKTLFQLVDPAESNLVFANDLQHDVSSRANLFDFDYFYNGAGVGIADINNDGLDDIFFCGNQVPNKLFLNDGELEFRDISESSGINNSGKMWSNGVTFADVNQDGWLDIYISQGGPHEASERNNLLLINQQDMTFVESAMEYGLADNGFSTQSAFFDYDKDGDLDCLVMNENPLYGTDPVTFYRKLRTERDLMFESSSHFYRNDDGIYTDVTIESGILRPSFGLGLVVSDLNDDGWLDFYMANDYFIPDAMFINQQNGTFFDEVKTRTTQTSFYGMGVDVADFNNDLYKDIFVLDMASADHYRSKTLMASMDVDNFNLLVNDFGFVHQYMFNSFHVNKTNNKFRNMANQLGLAKTDWSWAGLMADFDNDGWKDVLVTNGYRRYALDNDFKSKVIAAHEQYEGKVPVDVKARLYESMPSEKLPNLMYKNTGDLSFKDVSAEWGLDIPSFSNGAVYGDLDNDGDLDIVVNNLDDNAFLFRNTSANQPSGNFLRVQVDGGGARRATTYVHHGDQSQMVEIMGVRGYFSHVETVAHFGLGDDEKVDRIKVIWSDGKVLEKSDIAANQSIILNYSEANFSEDVISKEDELVFFTEVPASESGINYRHQENIYNDFQTEVLLPYKQSTIGPGIARGDINGDGAGDIFIGGAAGHPGQLFVQAEKGFVSLTSQDLIDDGIYEDVGALFFDLDSDGDLDLYVVSGGNELEPNSPFYEDRIYLNDGKGRFFRKTDVFNDVILESGSVVEAIDYDGDGDDDILLGNRIVPQHYPQPAKSYILENEDGILRDVTDQVASELSGFGIVNDILITDFDGDNDPDFMIAGEWGAPGVFMNEGGSFKNVAADLGLAEIKGWWYSITSTNLNGDEFPDYILGNVGLNTKFSASKEKPFKVYAGDFDENGTFDVVLSKKYKEEYVPVRGRECSSQQMPFISEKFKTFDAFANASVEDIFENKLKEAVRFEVNEFRSVMLINTGEGFEIKSLPAVAQGFPLLSCVSYDLNADGLDDLIMAGNIYDTEVETPRWDAGTGIVLLSDGENGYASDPDITAGFFLEGNVKSLELVYHTAQKTNYLVTARNNDVTSVLRIENK